MEDTDITKFRCLMPVLYCIEGHVQSGCTNPSGSATKAKKAGQSQWMRVMSLAPCSALQARCPVAGCREILGASNSVPWCHLLRGHAAFACRFCCQVVCGRCHQKVCLKHRFEEDRAVHRLARADAEMKSACKPVSAKEHACSGATVSKTIPTRASKPLPAPASGWQCSRCTLVNLASRLLELEER